MSEINYPKSAESANPSIYRQTISFTMGNSYGKLYGCVYKLFLLNSLYVLPEVTECSILCSLNLTIFAELVQLKNKIVKRNE